MAEEEYARARRDRVVEKIQNRGAVRYRAWQRDSFHHDAIAFGAEIPRMLAPGMLLVGDQHFVAGLQVNSVREVAVGLRGVAHEGEFLALTADKFGQRVAKLIPSRVAPDRIVLRIGLGETFGITVALEDGLEDRRRRRTHGSVVEIDFVLGNQKQLADFAPVSFFVRVVKAAVR